MPNPSKLWKLSLVHFIYRTRAIITRGLYFFYDLFIWSEVYITDNLWTKNGNSSFFKPKICGLYTRAVTDRERVIMARVRYLVSSGDMKQPNRITIPCHQNQWAWTQGRKTAISGHYCCGSGLWREPTSQGSRDKTFQLPWIKSKCKTTDQWPR